MGIGAAYSGLVWLLGNEGKKQPYFIEGSLDINIICSERCQERVTSVISFVAEQALIGIQRPADDSASLWYFNVSDNFSEGLLNVRLTKNLAFADIHR